MPSAGQQKHVREAAPIVFRERPLDGEESKGHRELCLGLYETVQAAVSANDTVGRQHVYYRADDPAFVLAPDVFVKLGVANEGRRVWKAWDRGAPDVAFEILGAESPESHTLDEKLVRYAELGVAELVVFDLEGAVGSRLRVWDRLDGDFVERIVDDERTPCCTLGYDLAIAPIVVGADAQYPACVRLMSENGVPVPTIAEAKTAAEQAELADAYAQRVAEQAQQAEADLQRAEAQSQRAQALARGDARAAEIEAAAARARSGHD